MPPATKRADSAPKSVSVPSGIPTPWGDEVEILDGLDIIDKAELIGRPFLIESVWFEQGARSVEYVYVQAQFENGTGFTFNDSSSGVYKQLESYMSKRGVKPEFGQVVPCKLMIPKGLRVSKFEVQDERGRSKEAKTYYLTTSGKKAE